MAARTPLFEQHVAAGGRMVDFAGWDLPVSYGSQVAEHKAVRSDIGVFDVSHMGVVDIEGPDATGFLRRLLAGDVARLDGDGQALYSCMLNAQGGVLDDVIVYRLKQERWRMVVNAGNRADDLAWMQQQAADQSVDIRLRDDRAILAVQGPRARETVHGLLPAAQVQPAEDLKRFACCESDGLMIGRTGYTGEDGYELILPVTAVVDWWQRLLAAGAQPCGLGARDTLRLEAGLPLHGHEMGPTVTPLEAGLDWTVSFDQPRDFIGRGALEQQWSEGVVRRQVGLVLLEKGVMRSGCAVQLGDETVGIVTSGGMSPSLERSIGLALVRQGLPQQVDVDIRGRPLAAQVVRPPFVRSGRCRIELPALRRS